MFSVYVSVRRFGSYLLFWGGEGPLPWPGSQSRRSKLTTTSKRDPAARKLNLWPVPLLNSVLSALLLCPARSDVPGHQSSLPLPGSESHINSISPWLCRKVSKFDSAYFWCVLYQPSPVKLTFSLRAFYVPRSLSPSFIFGRPEPCNLVTFFSSLQFRLFLSRSRLTTDFLPLSLAPFPLQTRISSSLYLCLRQSQPSRPLFLPSVRDFSGKALATAVAWPEFFFFFFLPSAKTARKEQADVFKQTGMVMNESGRSVELCHKRKEIPKTLSNVNNSLCDLVEFIKLSGRPKTTDRQGKLLF